MQEGETLARGLARMLLEKSSWDGMETEQKFILKEAKTKETNEDMVYSHTSWEKGTNYSLQYISSYQMLKKNFSFKPTS